jgi:hypothetical protein
MVIHMRYFILFNFLWVVWLNLGGKSSIYYIDPSGNDIRGSGSKVSPWKSLHKACETVSFPGDIIHVNKGTYIEPEVCNLSVGVSIEGEGDSVSIIQSKITGQFIPVIRLYSDKEGTNGNQHICKIKLIGNLTTFGAIEIHARSNISIYNCSFQDFETCGITFNGATKYQETGPSNVYGSGNKFYNNVISNCASYTGWGEGALRIGGQEGMLIYGNTISQTGRTPGTNGWPIKYYSGGHLRGVKIYNNILYKDDLSNWDFAIELFNVSGLEIFNNNITGSIDLNHQTKGDYEYSIYIHDNILGPSQPKSTDCYGIILEFDTDYAQITRNLIRNVSIGIMYSCRFGSKISNNLISYNIFYNLGKSNNSHFYAGIRFVTDGTQNYSVEKFGLYNNVFHSNPSYPVWTGLEMNFDLKKANNINIINNIFVNFYSNYFTSNKAGNIDNLHIENNILFNNGNRNNPSLTGIPVNYVNRNNIIANPQFYASSDFHLTPKSPAINSGLPISGLIKDFEGASINNPPNIGCYQRILNK